MKFFFRTALFLALFAAPLFAGVEPRLEQGWDRYNELFRSPREILFGVETELKDPDYPLRLGQAAELLRSAPNVEEAFAVLPCTQAEQEEMMIFQMLNSPPAEFGAWLEKLRPQYVRERFRKFVAWDAVHHKERDPCAPPDPLNVRCFYRMPGSTPFFKQPLPIGLYVRLKPDPVARAWNWKQQAGRLEDELRQFYEKSGWNPTITRFQYVPPSEPEAGPLLISFWLAVSLAGALFFFVSARRIGPFLGLLFALALCHLLLGWLATELARFIDPLLIPAGLLLTLFWGIAFYWRARAGEGKAASRDARRFAIIFFGAGVLALPLPWFAQIDAFSSLGLLLVGLPLGLLGIAFLLRTGWGSPASTETPTDATAHCSWPGVLARWKRSITFLLFLGLAVPLTLQKLPKFEPAIPTRPRVERIWSLKSDHAWGEERTVCVLAEASGWGDIAYELGAQRYAFTHAKEDKLVTRYWSPAAWLPRPVYQRSNAADFLRKRNAVVMEKIAQQERLTPKDFAPTVNFLNRVGKASLPLTQGENAEWVLSQEPDAVGLRIRQWLRTGTGPRSDSIAVLSYCFVSPSTPEPALLPWISKAIAPFGVEPEWVVPEILQQAAIRDMLARMACVSASLIAAFCFLAAGRRIRVTRAVLSALFLMTSWLLSLIALGWDWTSSGLGESGGGGGLWVWTTVAAWHMALCVEFFSREESDRTGVFAAATTAGTAMLAALWLWSLSGKSEGYAPILATGLFWSYAWCVLLTPLGPASSKKKP